MNIEHSASPTSRSLESTEVSKPEWRPLDSLQRRVIGVLIEKSKTTKDSYPLTLNSITTACNQKSNRSPQMDLAADDVQITLDELRDMNAVVEIQGTGRTSKFKHTMYQWLGVNKVELAVMGELLLRGEQTLGDLRARAARMEPIAGLSELKPIIEALIDKRLMVELTPPGRGQMVTHGLYRDQEMESLRNRMMSGTSTAAVRSTESVSPATAAIKNSDPSARIDSLQQQIDQMQNELTELKQRLDRIES